MNQNYNQESFNKGQAFEDYVEQVLFPASHYELLHKTNSFDQNSQRYVGDSRKPDFRFKCILTGFEFHIEAKYRTKPFQGHYDILSAGQVETFPDIHRLECPVYIALGYGGVASDPSYISLVPYEEHNDSRILVDDAVGHQILKQAVDSNIFSGSKKEMVETTKTFSNQESNSQQGEPQSQNEIKSSKKNGNTLLYSGLGILLIVLLSAVYFIPLSQDDSFESVMKSRVKNYYALSDANNLQELRSYISPDITYWYGSKNPSIQQVVTNIKEYRKKFPISESSVVWTEFDVTAKLDGGYYATYPLEYKVKSKSNAPFKSYDLKLLTVWDEEMRLLSIKEIRK